ncbi:MAG: hypothetical protein H0X51_03250 [Parachlamydiaceae bacterium]|nr:hypothetical protein [Parachlamydiaceae bacterium]
MTKSVVEGAAFPNGQNGRHGRNRRNGQYENDGPSGAIALPGRGRPGLGIEHGQRLRLY